LYRNADVAAMELCDVIMKWIEKKIQWYTWQVIWASNNTNDINKQH